MSLIVTDCPRCGANKITFEVMAQVYRGREFGWQDFFEIFCNCRSCDKPTIFLVSRKEVSRKSYPETESLTQYPGDINHRFRIERFISVRDNITTNPPDYLPENI